MSLNPVFRLKQSHAMTSHVITALYNQYRRNFFSMIMVIIMIAMSITACEEDHLPVSSAMPVIEGHINSNGNPIVLFSSSVVPETDGSLSSAVINWGRVSISDGEQEVILTGRIDDSYMPPFRYYTFDMVGVPGRTYTVKADFKDFHASAQCVMPYSTPIDSITLVNSDTDSLKAATLHFTAPYDVPAYYYLTMNRNNDRNSHPQMCLMGLYKAEKAGQHCSVAVWKPKLKIDTVPYVPLLKIGDDVTVHLNRVTKEVYDFWRAYDNMIMFSTSPFISSDAALPTNITGGAWRLVSGRHRQVLSTCGMREDD